MKVVLKILALPIMLALGVLFASGVWGGLAWMLVAFLISPYGLPKLAAWFVGKLGGAGCALRDFVMG